MLQVIEKGSLAAAHPTPLIFIHGGCSSADIWDTGFLDYFANAGYRAVAVSVRGHGTSTLSQSLNSCSIADYVDDVHVVAAGFATPPVLIGHSMGCWVALRYLETQPAAAAVLLAPGTPGGLRRWGFRTFLRHPWLVVRANTVGNTVDLFRTPALVRELLFSSSTPDSTVESCADQLQPESLRAARELAARPLPDPSRVAVPMLVVGAGEDASRVQGDASAVALHYRAECDIVPGLGHIMMLEPTWAVVADRISTWLRGQGL